MDCDVAGWVQVAIELLALVLGLVYYFGEYKRDRCNRKKNALASIRLEISQNWWYLNNPPLPPQTTKGKGHPGYYDPTRQVFKYHDDAITAVLCSDIVSEFDNKLVEALSCVGHSVRFVNQQIDELMSLRFGSPEMLSAAAAIVRADPGRLARFAKTPEQIPKQFRDYLQELALRHWAIVNEGYWRRLKPAIEEATRQLNPVLRGMRIEELSLQIPEATESVLTSSAPSLTGDNFDWMSSASTGSASSLFG